MNDNLLLPKRTKRIVYETLDHYWVNYPYKLSFGPKNQISSIDWVHKDIELGFVTQGGLVATLNGRTTNVKEGELFCVNSYVAHSFEVDENTRYIFLMISTTFLKEHGIDPSKLFFNEVIKDEKIAEFFEDIKSDNLFNDRFGIISVQGSILRLTSYIASNYSHEWDIDDEKNRINSYGLDFVYAKNAIDFITNNLQNTITLENVSAAIGISKYHFSRIFNRITGYTLVDYVNKLRCEQAKSMLQRGDISVKEAALSSGFNNFSYFAKTFKKHIGYLPSAISTKE